MSSPRWHLKVNLSAIESFGLRLNRRHAKLPNGANPTCDGKTVIAHNAGPNIKTARAGTSFFDVAPSEGYRILTDGVPELIHSGDDFGGSGIGL